MQYESFIFLLSHAYILFNSHIQVLYFTHLDYKSPHWELLFEHRVEDSDEDDYDCCYTERNGGLTRIKLRQWSNEDLQFYGGGLKPCYKKLYLFLSFWTEQFVQFGQLVVK